MCYILAVILYPRDEKYKSNFSKSQSNLRKYSQCYINYLLYNLADVYFGQNVSLNNKIGLKNT